MFKTKTISIKLEKPDLSVRPNIIEPNYSFTYLCGAFLMYCDCVASVIAFLSPYWIESTTINNSEFTNMGLWNVCFEQYKNLQASGNQYFDGCIWILSKDLNKLKQWLLPNWLLIVQAIQTLCFILSFVILILIGIGLFSLLRKKFYYVIFITILLVILSII